MRSPFRSLRPLVLASGSPRRQALLRELGLDFSLEPPLQPEPQPLPGEPASSYALRSAEAKAAQALAQLQARAVPLDPALVLIAADTVVALEQDGREHILGKPKDETEALDMLRRLAGREHTVITACCLLPADGVPVLFADRSAVHFAPWSETVLRAYTACGESLDKAGAYGIQSLGSFLADRIEGSWSTVVGLPVSRTMAALLDMGAIRPAPNPISQE